MSQQNPGRMSFFITGTNPKIVEENAISESDNPIYNFFERRYLNPFTSEDSEKLLKDIGSLIGIEWGSQALKMVHTRTGGHPLLLRAYGSVLHNSREHKDRTKVVKDIDISTTANQFLRKVEPQISQMINVLSKYYESEFSLLQTLAQGKISEFKEYAEVFPDDISHLKGYGIIEFSSSECFIKVEPLQTWLNRKLPPGSSNQAEFNSSRMIGKEIGIFKISSLIGHSGGFSDVYKAAVIEKEHSFDIDEESVAIKILKDGSILRLQREVDVLSKFDHPNIVKLITHGQTDDGNAYLVMEYLEGNTLREKCTRVLRLSPSEIKDITLKLLNALDYIHPNEEKVRKIRQNSELSPVEYAELELARHGKIHRDIKPENVILTADRGPVLIDFNISVSANDPMMTVSHTPGYLPEDLISGQQWTPDVDLYQLGLTLAQVATGISYEFSGERNVERLEDLRMQLHTDLPPALAMGLLKLFAKINSERLESAEAALSYIRSA